MSGIAVMPLCWYCEHAYDDADWRACKAFPRGIPNLILGEFIPGEEELGKFFRYDHREPLAGDNGIQFKRREGLSEDELIGLDNTIDELMVGRILGFTLPRLGK